MHWSAGSLLVVDAAVDWVRLKHGHKQGGNGIHTTVWGNWPTRGWGFNTLSCPTRGEEWTTFALPNCPKCCRIAACIFGSPNRECCMISGSEALFLSIIFLTHYCIPAQHYTTWHILIHEHQTHTAHAYIITLHIQHSSPLKKQKNKTTMLT